MKRLAISIVTLLTAAGVNAEARDIELLAMPHSGEDSLATQLLRPLNSKRLHATGPMVLRVPAEHSEALAHELLRSGVFEWVEYNRHVEPLGIPNDPFFGQQWFHNHLGTPRAWDFATGVGVKIAIVDTGIDLTHPEFAGRILPGYNSVDGLTVGQGGQVSDVQGHGTNMAGILGAAMNNSIGVAGVAPACSILPVRASNRTDGVATLAQLDAGVRWAADQGATAVTVSFSGVDSPVVQSAGAYAKSRGSVLVWAAGNLGQNWSSFDWPDVVVVGGTGLSDERASWGANSSAFGKAIDIVAPARVVRTTQRGGGYQVLTGGTSFAAPMVAGALALIKQVASDRTPSELVFRLEQSAVDLGTTGNDEVFGAGRINVAKAVIYPAPVWRARELPLAALATSAQVSHVGLDGIAVGSQTIGGRSLGCVWNPEGVPTVYDAPAPLNNQQIDFVKRLKSGKIAVSLNSLAGWFDPAISTWTLSASHSSFNKPQFTGPNQINESGQAAFSLGHSTVSRQRAAVVATSATFDFLFGPTSNYPLHYVYDINDAGLTVGLSDPDTTARPLQFWLKDLAGGTTYFSGEHYQRINNSGALGGNRSAGAPEPLVRWPDGSVEVFPSSIPPYNFQGSPANVTDEGWVTLGWDIYLQRGPGGGATRTWSSGPIISYVNGIGPGHFNGLRIADSGKSLAINYYTSNFARNVPYAAELSDSLNLNVNLGQFGDNGQDPITVGTIPPVVAVTFTDVAGTPFPGQPTNGTLVTYSSSEGTANFPSIPAFVTGPFRILFKANKSVIPSLSTCSWLNRLYPPLGEQALPLDTLSIPRISLLIGDINHDNEVGPADFSALAQAFGSFFLDPNYREAADITGDGEVGPADFAVIAENFGEFGD